MTAKEKSKELVEKYKDYSDPFYHECQQQWEASKNILDNAKQCALIAVDEILDLMILKLKWSENENGNVDYWLEVRHEIKNL